MPDTVAKITQAAEKLFVTYGIRSVTMHEIARQLGISKKTIYQHFQDKDELVLRVTELLWERDFQVLLNIESEAHNAIEAASRTTRYILEVHQNFNPSMMYDIEKYYPESWRVHKTYMDQKIYHLILENMHRGIQEGLYRKDLNMEILTRMRLSQMEVTCNPEIFPPHIFEFADIIRELSIHFFRGIVTREGLEKFETYISHNHTNP